MTMGLFFNITIIAIVIIIVIVWRFLGAVGKAVEHPRYVTVKPIKDLEESGHQIPTYFIQSTFNLRQFGFNPLLDFMVPELPHPGIFRAFSSNDNLHTAIIHEIYPKVEGQAPSSENKVNYCEFETVLSDGSKVNTNNAPLPLPLAPPPNMIIIRRPKIEEVRLLYKEHLAGAQKVSKKRKASFRYQYEAEFISEFQKDWERVTEHNIKKGILKRSGSGSICHGTAKLAWNYFKGMLIG